MIKKLKIFNKREIRIGCSGWHYKEWVRKLYPANASPNDWFSYYAGYFKTVEINSTFYHFPSLKTLQRWYTQAPKGFKYSIKVNRYLTHLKKFKDVREPLKQVYGLNEILQEKVGCFLFQFPSSFIFGEKCLERIVSQLNDKYENVIEFRHPSWWNTRVIHALASMDITFCSAISFNLPEDLTVINGRAYMRFHGNPSYSANYSEDTLILWAQIIKDTPFKELWVYFNNTQNACAIQNALYLEKLLKS